MAAEWEDSTAVVVIKSFFICSFIIAAVIGNVCVIYAISNYKKLQTVPNYFVLNLAVADFLFAVTGMPMIVVTTIAKKWVLGKFMCDVSGFVNSLFCTVSIWTLVMISVNRYFAVAKARDIKKIYTKKRTYALIVIVWVFSILISMPPIFGWSEFKSGTNFCTVNGQKHFSYSVFLGCTDYFIPIFLLSGLYLRIFLLLKKHERIMRKANPGTTKKNYDEFSETSDTDVSIHDNSTIRRGASSNGNQILAKFISNQFQTNVYQSSSNERLTEKIGEETPAKVKKTVSIKMNDMNSTTTPEFKRKGTHSKIKWKKFFKEARITKMLLIVVLGFLICWTPFIVASIVYALGFKPEFRWLSFGIVIACLNSVINPIIYSVMNRNFRNAFDTMVKTCKSFIKCSSK